MRVFRINYVLLAGISVLSLCNICFAQFPGQTYEGPFAPPPVQAYIGPPMAEPTLVLAPDVEIAVEMNQTSAAGLAAEITGEEPLAGLVGGPPVGRINIYSYAPGYSYAVEPVYVLLPAGQPYILRLSCSPFVHTTDAGVAPIEAGILNYHEAKSDPLGEAWIDGTGQSEIASFEGDAEGWLQLQFRAYVDFIHPPGEYISPGRLEFAVYSPDNLDTPVFSGQIPLEFHLFISPMIEASISEDIIFAAQVGNETGWIYSTNEPVLNIRSNLPYGISVTTGADLELGGSASELETALQFREPNTTGALWREWGDIGSDEHDGITHPWPEMFRSASGTWPGNLTASGVGGHIGEANIGIKGAAWRKGLMDLAGDYNSTVVVTVYSLD